MYFFSLSIQKYIYLSNETNKMVCNCLYVNRINAFCDTCFVPGPGMRLVCVFSICGVYYVHYIHANTHCVSKALSSASSTLHQQKIGNCQ
jgi:hypothetical protein